MMGYFHNTDNDTPKKREYGGGFLPETTSPGHPGSPTTTSTTKKPHLLNPTLRPVTLKQLNEASQSFPEGPFKIDNADLNQVIVMGCIRAFSQQAAGITYTIEDGTGSMDARRWTDGIKDDHDENNYDGSSLREGIWVRIAGMLRSFGNKKSLNIYDIQPLESFDAFIYHMASCLQYHYYYAKQVSLTKSSHQAGSVFNTGFGATPYSTLGGNTLSSSIATHPYNDTSGSDLNPAQKLVLDMFSGCTSNEGLNIDVVCRQLKTRLKEEETRGIIEWLIEEGHLYSTIDNNHAKSTTS